MKPLRSVLPPRGIWQLPILGQPAAETLPDWLIERLNSKTLVINHLGGFTLRDAETPQSSVAGDLVILTADDRIEFRRPEDEPAPLLAAA